MSTRCFEFKVMLFIALFFVYGFSMTQAQTDDVTVYEKVTVSIPATGYDASKGPEMARVKYNKTFPLVITSDDMGKTELTNNWAEVNGYPNVSDNVDLGIQPGGSKLLAAPYKKYYMQHESSDVSDYQPMTYTDNVGKTQRYRMTSAIMPYLLKSDGSSDYSHIDANDAKLMLRTGWSFAQHDVDDISSVANISTAMTANSTQWANKVGIGLKVMVEPNGNHNYLAAGSANSGICWNIFQNPTSEYPGNSKTLTSWTNSRTDWSASGIQNMPTTFSSKPTGGYARTFFQGNESSWKTNVDDADGTRMIIGGTHGLGNEIKQHLRTAANVKDNAWVGSADEVWEYYHIYNKVKIENVSYNDNKLTFDVLVPTYQKNQYRELTLNIPGLTGGQAPTFTSTIKPVTGGYNADGGTGIGYTMNIGLENSIKTHINELMTIYRDDQTNEFVKRDIRYLASQLWDASACIASLDAAPVYSHTINARLDGTSDSDYPLAMIKTDTNGDKSFRIPRYVAKNGSLYETDGAAAGPKYAKTIATAGTSSDVDYANKNLDGRVVLYAEGEDLEGTTVIGADLEYNEHQDGRYYATNVASMGMAGSIVSGSPATVSKTLPRGKYKITVGYGESYKSQGTYNYNVKVGDTQVYTFANSDASDKAVTEFTSDAFNIEQDNTPVTITTDNSNADSRWIDYVYVQKTADLAAIAPTMTFTSSTTASTIKTGTTATLTANALPNGGSNLTTSIYAADSEGNILGSALATGGESVSYAFTPDAAGTSYFLAQSTNSAGVTNSELIALTATDITNYTLSIIDKSGNVALTTTVAASSLTDDDPLPDAYRSPFAQNYKYYNTIAEAQANSGSNLTSTDDWIQSTVYVGYDVDATKMAANKAYAIIASNSNIYMHVNFRVNESHSADNRFWTVHQQWDVSNGNGTKLNATNLPFIDDNYLWELGDDPYNIQIKNKKTGLYNEPVSTDSQGTLKASATASYCLLYWNAETAGSNYTLRYREATPSVTPYYVAYTTINDGDWRVRTSADEADAKLTLLYDATLPDLNINVQQTGSNDVEATLKLHYVSTAKMSDFSTKLPYFLRRAYTKDAFAFYYDAAGEHAITTNATFDTNYFDGSNIYLRYTPVDDWNTDNLFLVSTAEQKTWYAILYNNSTENNQQYLYLNTSNNQVRGKYKKNSSAIDENFNWALIGSPYALRLVNRAAKDKYIGLPQSTSTAAYAQPYAENAEGIITDWELTVVANSNANSYPSIRPQGSFSQSDRPWFYLCTNGDSPSLQPLFSSQDRIIKAYEKIVTIDVTYHVKDNASGQVVDFTITTIAGNNIGTLPTSLVRRGTKNVSLHTGSFEGSAIAADAISTTELTDIYVTYDIDYTDNADNNQLGIADMFSTWENQKWFTIKNGTQQIYYGGNNDTSVQNNRNGVADSDLWAFIGTPYKFEIINYLAGASLHAATNAKDKGSWVYMQDDDESYPYYYWETVTTTKNGGGLAIRLTGTDYCLSFAQTFNSNHGVISVDGNNQADKLTIAPVLMVTFNIYGPDNTLSLTHDLPISLYTDMTIYTGSTASNNLEKELKRRYVSFNTISTNADFSSPTDSYTVTAESANQTVYMKWDYADDAPVFSTGSEPRDYQYYMMNASNGSASYVMKVKGNSTDGYTLAPNDGLTPLKEGHHQFAMVGTPYGFNLYSRYAGMNVKTNSTGSDLVFSGDATTEAVFDLPIPVNSAITQSTQMDLRMKNNPSRHIWSDADNIWMNNSTGGYLLLTHLIAPVSVFKEGSTAIGNIVDHQEYALALNPNGTARATTERITDADLYPSTLSGSANYYTKDFRHAFCDYTFYHTYDWETGTLSNAIPTTGTYAGLPYYGGSSDQFARAFFATYTVDEEQFSKVYLLDNANSGTPKYFGSGDATTSGDNVYYPTVSDHSTVGAARNDDTNAYRWVMTGDPYNLQLTCLGTGDDYEEIPLGVTTVSTTNAKPTQSAGTLALLTNDATYAVKSHWEVILNNDGNHIFYLVDDVATYDDEDRYTYSLGTYNYMSTELFASSDKLYTLHLTPAVPQYDVVWKVMEGSSGSYTEVASYTKENVSKGTTLTLADMPEVLRRHFCKYENMYSNEACTMQYAGNEATVGDAELDIYVPYTLAAGAPMFYESVATFNAATGDDKDPVLIRLNHAKYAYTTAATDESATTTDSKQTASASKWVLIGSPYNVKLYNILTGKYLYVNWSNISPNAVIPMDASPATGTTNDTWTILDDATGDYAVLCLKEDDNHQMLFIGYDGSGNVVMNIPNSKSEAMTAEFLGSNGIDNPTLVLHYGANTLRKDANNNSMAGQTENFQVSGFFNLGTPLVDIMPSVMKRPFCNYTFEYDNVEYETVVKDPMCTDSQPITIDVYYTRDESLFKWSTATTDYTGKYWYYLVNNHVPAGSSEQGKMYYRDSSPKLRVSEALVQNKLYLNNYEWCVIGDPYGFKMLNHYDPDRKFSEYIRVMNYNDNHNDGLQLEQNDDNDDQNIFEMMPGTYSYNFWMHPVYSSTQLVEYAADSYSFVSQNYNGSAAIIPTGKKTMAYLKTNSSANLRLEILSDATLAEYVKYAGFVGALKYDVANSDDVADIKARVLDGTATDADKTMLHNIINDPANIEQMVQGYYRIVPYMTEDGTGTHMYLRGYWSETEQAGDRNLKVIPQSTAEYAPTSIFWFEGTTSDGTANGYPRYFIKTQDLCLGGNGLVDVDAATNYKSRYEDLGAAVTQLKISDTAASAYLSCTSNATEASTNQCFDEQAGQFKTRFYLQKVGTGGNEMPYKIDMVKGHNGINGEYLLNGDDNPYGKLPYTYWAIYVPYDLQIVGGLDAEGHTLTAEQCDVVPFVGIRENYHPAYSETGDTYYNEGEYALICQSIDEHQKKDEWKGSNLYIPAATPVFFRSRSGMTGVTFKVATTAPTTDSDELKITENCLKGSYLSRTDTNGKIRVFGKEAKLDGSTWYYTGRVGLFPRSSASTPLTDNGIYYVEEDHISSLPNTNSARAVFLTFDESEEDIVTGIYSAVGTPEKDVIYDLQGRKMTGTLKAGVYIKNGRKIVVK